MNQTVEHKVINPDQCPRCGGLHTKFLGNDGTMTDSYICLDCDAKNPEAEGESPGYYEVVRVDVIGSVIWTDEEEVEHEVHDTQYLAILEAENMVRVLERAFDRGYFDPHPDDSEEEADEKREAREILARAKGALQP